MNITTLEANLTDAIARRTAAEAAITDTATVADFNRLYDAREAVIAAAWAVGDALSA